MDSKDMSAPVTRGELREELANLATKAELANLATKAELANLATKAELANLATKVDLELWAGALLARMTESIERSEQRLLAELARHTNAIFESMAMQIRIIDDKYADLPARTNRLEAKVFGPEAG
jgi:hypothetical protein